jgi:FKBP-type peptidyl-prolyl cis-trans isomerase FkpA
MYICDLKHTYIMNKFKFYFISLIATIVAVSSCNNDDDDGVELTPPKPYAEQYAIDSLAIDDYLKTNYISNIVNAPGLPEDQDVIIKKITDAATQPSLWSYLNSPTLPRLSSRNVSLHGLTYKFYTLLIREGSKGTNGVGKEYPSNVDAVFAGYKGTLLDGTVFDSSNNGQNQFNLDGTQSNGGNPVIRGWSEGFPQFQTGWLSSNPTNGAILYNDFGVGMMFIPSAMGYYNRVSAKVPAYSPLVFSVKLYAIKRFDHDADGIPSYQEDFDGDRYMNRFATGVPNPDDTDKDEIPDFLDFDDDGDNFSTRGEVKDKNGNYYPFDLIPDCDGDQTKPGRLKRHLDPKCTKMSQ